MPVINTKNRETSYYKDLPWNDCDPVPFLEKNFSKQFLIVFPILKKLLPEQIFIIYFAWKKEVLWEDFFTQLSTALGGKLTYSSRPIANGGPTFHSYRVLFERDDLRLEAGGQSVVSGDEALSKAVGELLERFTFHKANQSGDSLKISNETAGACISLEYFPLYKKWQQQEISEQFVTRKNYQKKKIAWIGASSLLTSRKKFIPAQRVLWGMKTEDSEGIVNHSTTSGGGGGYTKEEAVLSALYEAVERDSFLCHWLQKITPKQVDPSSVSLLEVQDIIDSLNNCGIKVQFMNTTTTLGVPSIATILTRKKGSTHIQLGMGAAAGFDPKKLFLHSLIEASSVTGGFATAGSEYEIMSRFNDQTKFRDRTISRSKRLSMWRNGVTTETVDWFLNSTSVSIDSFIDTYRIKQFSTKKEELETVREICNVWVKEYGEGYHPYVYYPTNHKKILRMASYVTASVVVPSLYPIYLYEHLAPLDVSALTHWRDTPGESSKGRDPIVTNPIPHPFP